MLQIYEGTEDTAGTLRKRAMLAVVLGFIGLVLGICLFNEAESDAVIFGDVVLAMLLGVALGRIGKLAQRQRALTKDLQALRSRLDEIEAVPQAAAVPAPGPALPEPVPAAIVAAPPVEPEPEPEPVLAAAEPAPPLLPRGPNFIELGIAAARGWLFGGNTAVRVGIVVLFFGLAFFLNYASEQGWLSVEMRYAGVGLAGIVLQIIGWRLRESRRTYGLVLQGGAVAVLYLTIFAAMRLNQLIPPEAGFALLVAVVVFSAMLAVLQDAQVLAAAGAAGGFAAPILASTGGEHHVALFLYFLLLDAGILSIAWFKAWRPLNLIGFLGTLGLGAAWAADQYRPEMLASTEPFLIVFFLMFVAIALLFGRRRLRDAEDEPPAGDRMSAVLWAAQRTNYLDGVLLFGAPLAAFALQVGLMAPYRYGAAFSALALGFFYILLAAGLLRGTQRRYLGLLEVFIALGVVFGTLAVPLGLDARWTSAAWAIEGAGLYWIALRQDRRVGRGFATLLQFAAGWAWLQTLMPGTEGHLIDGTPLGAAMVAASLLSSFWQLHQTPLARHQVEDRALLALFTAGGLFFLALVAPLTLGADGTAIAWALLGLAALAIGLRLRRRPWLASSLAIQLPGGLVFLTHLQSGQDGAAVLGSGLEGLFVAALIGGAALACVVLLARDVRATADPAVLRGLSALLIFSLVFLNLAVLFILPWSLASGVWAASGTLILIWSLRLRQWLGFGFGLALQLIGGIAFLTGAYPALEALPSEGLTPLGHSGFWAPAVIALAALVGAWRLHRAGQAGTAAPIPSLDFALQANILLGWAALWWLFAWEGEIFRFLLEPARPPAGLLVAAVTALALLPAARRWDWHGLALLASFVTPIGVLVLLGSLARDYNPGGDYGWLAWPAALAAHLAVLRWLEGLLPRRWPNALHVLGCWLALAVAALELRWGFILLSDRLNAWRWLGWAAVPAFYLLAMAQRHRLGFWPIHSFEREYRAYAALPVALVLLAWFWLGAMLSDGDATPLPYLPLVNPLELGQALVLFGLFAWARGPMALLPRAERVPASALYWVLGPSALLLLTGTVLRTAHHWAGVPYETDALLGSMLVQASLSMLWALAALGLMVFGHARALRVVWIAGAVLIAAVVLKLFLVELTNTGGLPRIVSFIGVGVLLLLTGYFAPLPPKRRVEDAVL
jgi:uncharacterized membrane protein